MYVELKSDHPCSVKKAIPYGLAIRLKRICSDEKDYRKHRRELKYQLRGRGYSMRFVESQLRRVDNLKREDLLKYRHRNNKNGNNRVPLVLTYAKQLPEVREIVQKRMGLLYRSERMKRIFEKPPLIAFRRDKNVADILVHGKLNRIMKNPSEGTGHDECIICNRMVANTITSTDGSNQFEIHKYDGCSTQKCGLCHLMQQV